MGENEMAKKEIFEVIAVRRPIEMIFFKEQHVFAFLDYLSSFPHSHFSVMAK